jgi:cyclic beta-1,2-glucan synthetase
LLTPIMPTETFPLAPTQTAPLEVLSRLEQTARQVATGHQATAYVPQAQHLLQRLPCQAKRLRQGYHAFRNSTAEALAFSYAAEWLLDNFYVVEQTQRQIKDDLSPAFYRNLPRLNAGGPLQDYPRVYDLARQLLIAETCQLDLERIHKFVWSYEAVTPLAMGELWALPIMLRLALLESMTEAVGRLANLTPETEMLPQALPYSHTISDTDVVANCIPSLRLLAGEDWLIFFERISQVEQILRQDPAGVYARMDFETRDRYRKVVERVARATDQEEAVVAQTAVALAHRAQAANGDADSPTHHVGAYLLADGLSQLEKATGYQPRGLSRWRRKLVPYTTPLYLGSLGLLTLIVALPFVVYALRNGTGRPAVTAVLFTLIPAITIAVTLVNWLVTHLVSPRVLPKLDFLQNGVPADCRAMVVIPTLLTHPEEVDSLLKQVEMHYLRNPDPHLSFALLTDFADTAAEKDSPINTLLLDQTQTGIEALNKRYPGQPFYLFHRQRQWNPRENTWMGWERKRGKLHEFNQLLRGHSQTSYTIQVGNLDVLPAVQYIITLDADTILPREGANRLIGALAHPLNQAHFDPHSGKVTAGYTILQPRTQIQPASANRSFFSRIFAGDNGLDLYTLAVSDVYQDLFGEGSYVGKGIYHLDAFERSLVGRIPENSLLSHDLFEGIYGRAGLATDIVLYEQYPANYFTSARRAQRWVRGDWQLLPWLLPWVPVDLPPDQPGKRYGHNDLSMMGRWKIADNLRRSLLAPALLLLFVAAWLWLPGAAWLWTLLGLFASAVPLLTGLGTAVRQAIGGSSWMELKRPLGDSAIRWLLFLTFLPYESLLTVTAIGATLWRLLVSRRNLLQWTTAAASDRRFSQESDQAPVYLQLLLSGLLAVVLAGLVYVINPAALPVAVPLLLLWAIAPKIIQWINRPNSPSAPPLQPAQRQQLHTLARRTWLFFEEFVGPDDNWLPPDHFQESPRGVVAHRTSPTNIGLYLLSVLGAYDLGYLSPLTLTLRLRSTFATLDKLDRYRGHFLNWIDTRTLAPLPPSYVSTVDSGNLAGCLLTLKQGLLTLPQQPAWSWRQWQGLLDTLAVLSEALDGEGVETAVQQHLTQMRQQILDVQDQPEQWAGMLRHLLAYEQPALSEHLIALVEASETIAASKIHTWRVYAERISRHLQGMQRELNSLLPWALSFSQPPTFLSQASDPAIQIAWQNLLAALPLTPRLDEIADLCTAGQSALAELDRLLLTATPADARDWCDQLAAALQATHLLITSLIVGFATLARQADSAVADMDFGFLFSSQRQIFHIGYSLATGRLDANFYDLLASESRIASLIAIAQDQVPQSHWLHLGRPLTKVKEGLALLSWSGTMFEYLMPPLLMRSYAGTFLNQSYGYIVAHQMAYGQAQQAPWGISESGYYAFDASQNYQYRAFGAPGIGFKRGLADDLVITPYASLLALPFQPQAVSQNMAHLTRLGMMGRYGFYEALDFSPARLELGQSAAIVRSYMAHHQGMILLSLVNFLHDNPMVARFHADPHIQSVELLLQEQAPLRLPDERPSPPEESASRLRQTAVTYPPWSVPTDTPMPLAHYLSNGRYHTLLSNAGGGYSSWQEVALTRWRPDIILDNWGQWLYLQDLDSGAVWSAGLQPTAARPAHQELLFHPHMVEFRRYENQIALQMSVAIAPEDDVEIRHVNLTNDSDRPRRLRLTSYAEVVLGPAAADQRHPAFANLFVESEYLPDLHALLFRRRPRSANDEPLFLLHMLLFDDVGAGLVPALERGYESDRAKFLGRGRTSRNPAALTDGLSQSSGATLDPVMALSQTVSLAPHTSTRLAFITLATPSRRQALAWAARYRQWLMLDRAFNRARSLAEQELRLLEITSPQLEQMQRLLSLLLYPHPARRANADILAANSLGQPGLWAFGISGDYPILLVQLHQEADGELLLELLRAHAYWRRRDLKIDLVILNQQESNYGQEMQGFIYHLIHRTQSESWLNRRGGLFVLREDQMSLADRILLKTTARALLDGSQGTLERQLASLLQQAPPLPAFTATLDSAVAPSPTPPLPRPTDWQFDNGLGGFSADGKEYQIYLPPGATTPAPWINVVANETVGFAVSETGGGFTWAVNSGENRLTAWRNDPVSDVPSELLYLRDEETAELWSPTPQPAPDNDPYLVRHGAGYTIFQHHSHGLKQETRLFVAPDDPIKVIQVRLENSSQRPRRLTLTLCAEWALGTNRESSQPYLIPSYDRERFALLARNPYNSEFGERVAFVAASKAPHGFTADRAEFFGRLGDHRRPAALGRIGLNNQVKAGLDSCAALQLHLDLPPGGSETVCFFVGQGANQAETESLLPQFQEVGRVTAVWQAVHALWDELLGAVTVETPDPAMNLLLNRWLLYQTVACRLWGRSALYQSSGAYGFRDQLQDVMALLHTRPDLARDHILRAAWHQFEAGDVLHWWHPPSGRGVRTRISDDLLWLPYVTAHYVAVTGDETILQETAPFLIGDPLADNEEERYGWYATTDARYSLLEHCRRALHKGTTFGQHGLPLIGGGDWNDGMNRVGIAGRGESVWLGWFLYQTLHDFAALCERVGADGASAYRQQAAVYQQALETHGWDGAWYRRAYDDDGVPLGSAQNQEARIDAIAQSWAVLSGAADPQRARQAMHAAYERLVLDKERLILLLTPPFDKTARDPGYIKGYLPGIRENGGQYSHAAVWTIWAFARLGEGDVAHALFDLINPITHADTPEKVGRYKVEPYVLAADVYGVPPNQGRGGWTWYTGSSGWLVRLGVEGILGLRKVGQTLVIEPCIPQGWREYRMVYRYGRAAYHIHVKNPAGVQQGVVEVWLDGQRLPDPQIPLQDDGQSHQVAVSLPQLGEIKIR